MFMKIEEMVNINALSWHDQFSNTLLLEFCGDLKDLVDDLDQVDRLGDIDMEPMDLLGTNDTDNFDLFAEIEKYENSNSATSTNCSFDKIGK